MLLCDIPREPVHLTEAGLRNRTVYTVHEYSWFNVSGNTGSAAKYLLTALAVPFSVFCCVRARSHIGAPAELTERHSARARLGLDPHQSRRARGMLPQARDFQSHAQAAGWCSAPLWLEAVAAGLLALLSLLCRCTGRALLRTCDMRTLVAGQLLHVCCLFSASAGLVLWLRLALALLRWACARQRKAAESSPTEEGRSRTGEPAQGLELTSRPCAEGAPHAGAPPARLGSAPPLPGGTGSGAPLRRGPMQRRMRWLDQALSARCLQLAVLAAVLGTLVFVAARAASYEAFAAELDHRWGFLLEGRDAAPLWLGEFGTDDPGDPEWAHLGRYIREGSGVGILGPERGKIHLGQETFGLLEEDSATVRHGWKLRDLRALIRAAGLLPPERPSPSPSPPSSSGSSSALARSSSARPVATLSSVGF
ncbi:unnamed protein product [Prorocentrum cordatum]|uniref:Cellulase n=1 Tax=Prorocentrum cordatum TaxID=2364126 RepID=A0ABN9SH28_9DINO|nr:unnamed protein product [Polarella glacialis]